MTMNLELSVVVALLVASVVGMVAQRRRLPYTVSLVLAGLGLAVMREWVAPGFDHGLHLTPQLLFMVLLPVLVFEAAFHMDLRRFRENWRAIVALAVPGVVLGIALVVPLAWLGLEAIGVDVDWRVMLLVATILAATDPVGVLAVLKEVGAPRRLRVIMEGEALLNDGVAIVAFGVVLVIVGLDPHHGALTVSWVARFLTWELCGALLIGSALGLGLSWLTSKVDDHLIEITLTTIAAFGAFVLADLVHASGIIACLVAGMVSGNFGARFGMSPTTRVAVTSFWEYLAFAANSIVFILIGLEVSPARLLHGAVPVLIVWLAVMLARVGFVVGVLPLLARWGADIPRGFTWVLSWGGLRGGVAMVLALSVPRDFAGRADVIDLVFGVSLLTILLQAPLTGPMLRFFRLVRDRGQLEELELLGARLRALQSAAGYLHRQHEIGAVSVEVHQELESELVRRRQELELQAAELDVPAEQLRREEELVMRRQLAVVEKEAIRRAFADGLLEESFMRRLVGEIDDRLHRLRDEVDDDDEEG